MTAFGDTMMTEHPRPDQLVDDVVGAADHRAGTMIRASHISCCT
jgi:hypothetical protein